MNPTIETLAARYERDQCPAIAAGLRDANQTGRPVLVWRSIRPRGFQADAQPIPDGMTPAETWHACQMADPDAYDRPAVLNSRGGPYSIHSPALQ